jgi:PAS domain S-box-containing protein
MLSDYYYSRKDYIKAFNHYHASWIYKSRMNRDQSNKEIATLEAHRSIRAIVARNERLEQETRITELKNRNSKLGILLFEILFLILFALLLYFYNLYGKSRKRKTELENLNHRLSQEIDEKKTAQAKLERSEALHRFIAENSVAVISLFDGALRRKYISPSCLKIFGLQAHEILAMKSPLDLVDPSYRVHVNQKLIEMMRTRQSTRYIYKALHTGGTPFWAEAVINPVVSKENGEIADIIMVDRNVEERMNHEVKIAANARQKEILLNEIHNRVKNNFAILFSLMNMQRDQTSDTDLKNSLADLQLRVKTMSLVHEQLYKTNEISTIPFNNYVNTLAGIIDSSFKNNRINLITELVPCELNIEMTLPLGLIINELITNAYKYAFPDERTGTVVVKLQETGTDNFCITICDNGIGLPENFTMDTTTSMGSQIIGILVAQIEARLEVLNDAGACFRIFFSTKNNV